MQSGMIMRPLRVAVAGALAAVTAATAGLTACKGERVEQQGIRSATADGRLDTTDNGAGARAEERGVSLVRMINALPTEGATSVSADDQALFGGVTYRTVTPYAELTDNIAHFRLQSGARDTTISSNNEILLDGAHYTLMALPEDHGGVRLRVLRDEFGDDSSRARLRVVHALSGVGEIDVLLATGTEPLFDNVSPASEAGFEAVEASPVTLVVRADGSGRQLLKREMRFERGHSYTLVLAGRAGQRIDAIVVDDRPVALANPDSSVSGGKAP